MARGAMRSALTACLGLVVLQKLTTVTGSSSVSGLIDAANSVVKRAIDPNVPAIPDLAGGGGGAGEQAPLPSPTVPAPSSVPPNPRRVPIPAGPAVPYF